MKTDDRVMLIPDFIIVLKSLEDGKEKTMSDIFVQTRITYCHLYKIKRLLLKKNWIKIRQEEKTHHISIAEKGIEVVNAASTFLEMIGIKEKDFDRYRTKTKTKHKEEPKDEIETLIDKSIENPGKKITLAEIRKKPIDVEEEQVNTAEDMSEEVTEEEIEKEENEDDNNTTH